MSVFPHSYGHKKKHGSTSSIWVTWPIYSPAKLAISQPPQKNMRSRNGLQDGHLWEVHPLGNRLEKNYGKTLGKHMAKQWKYGKSMGILWEFSMDWFSRENWNRLFHDWGFPVNFPLNQTNPLRIRKLLENMKWYIWEQINGLGLSKPYVPFKGNWLRNKYGKIAIWKPGMHAIGEFSYI